MTSTTTETVVLYFFGLDLGELAGWVGGETGGLEGVLDLPVAGVVVVRD